MKKTLIILVFFFSSSVFAQQSIFCKFYYIEGMEAFDGYNATFFSFWKKVPWFNVNFKSNNKEDWYIENLFADKEYLKKIENEYRFEVDALAKIDKYKKSRLTFAEEDFVRNLAKRYNTSPDEMFSKIKSLKTNELLTAVADGLGKKEYIEKWYKYLDDEDFSNSEHKEMLNNLLSNVSSDGEYVTIKSSSQLPGLKIINKINYSQIMKDDSEGAMELQISIGNDPFITFDSICSIISSNNSTSSSTSNSNDFEEQLTKLKSLFDKGLITQDEYDEKRKEILDAM